MSAPAHQPTLLTLPLELLSQIVEVPQGTHSRTRWPRGWLAINASNKPQPNSTIIPDEDFEPIRSLRALSQTCKSLRSFTLPLLWSTASVRTIDELGRLRETLRISPALTAHIRTFYFAWYPEWLDDRGYMFRDAERKRTQPLDFAFTDRWRVWIGLASRLGAEVQYTVDEYETTKAFFVHKGKEYKAPGKPTLIEECDPKQTSSYEWSEPWEGEISGPDGNGEDRLVKSAKDFNECVTEILGQLCALDTFCWSSPMAPIPRGAFDALAKLSTIKRFQAELLMQNGDVHSLPFWNAVSRVEVLSLTLYGYLPDQGEVAEEDEVWADDTSASEEGTVEVSVSNIDTDEQEDDAEEPADAAAQGEEFETVFDSDETSNSQDSDWESWELMDAFIDFDLPEATPRHLRDSARLHSRIAARTIIAAARGGRLRHLELDSDGERPHAFAIRSAVPFWVNLETLVQSECQLHGFTQAAALLRPFLTHASLWLDTPANAGARHDRHLTTQQVQALLAFARLEGLPKLCTYSGAAEQSGLSDGREEPLLCYLDWMEYDEELASRVSEAWNAVVEHGEANNVMCCCKRCKEMALVGWVV